MTSAGRVSAVNVGEHPAKGWVVAVIGKRTYDVKAGRSVEASNQLPLNEQPVAADDGVDLATESDLVMHRDQADVIIQGHVYPHGSRPAVEAAVAIDDFVVRCSVFGNRRLELKGDKLVITPPEPFDQMPLGWRNAYGGLDAAAHRAHGGALDDMMKKAGIVPDPRFGLFAYPRNPLGKGYLSEITPESVAACELPNLESGRLLSANDAVWGPKAWPRAPRPFSTTWLPYSFFPRSLWLGLPMLPFDDTRVTADDFPEVREGVMRRDCARPDGGPAEQRFSPLVSQAAPVGLRCRRVDPAATIRVVNLHPGAPRWDFRLPGDAPRMYVRWPGQQATAVRPEIRTLVLEPDENRVTLVWVGELIVPAPFPLASKDAIEHAVRWRSG